MQPIDEGQEAIINDLKARGIPYTYRCANCGVWQGEDHQPTCPGAKPVVVEVPKDQR